MKNEIPAQKAQKKIGKDSGPPEQGADSQLHCYNAVSWRLAEMFDGDDEIKTISGEKRNSPRRP